MKGFEETRKPHMLQCCADFVPPLVIIYGMSYTLCGRPGEMLTYKFRIYPTPAQARLMEQTFETCRKLYNSMLADRMENGTGFYEQKKMLVEMKRDDKHLKSIHSQVLQDVVLSLDKTYQA